MNIFARITARTMKENKTRTIVALEDGRIIRDEVIR